jgi:hypothetical protein
MRTILWAAALSVACGGSDDSGSTTTTTDTGTSSADTGTTTTDTGTPTTDTGTATDSMTTMDVASDAPSTKMGCSCNDTATSYCSEIVGPSGTALTTACNGMKSGCTSPKAYADAPCPTAGEIGRCVSTSGSLTGSNVFYSTGSMPWTADKAKGTCSMKETWTPK